MPEVALAVVFNHRYEQNLPKLRAYYGNRFPSLSFIMPFSRQRDGDVISVYESSYRFQSYIAQAWSTLERSPVEYFAFTADDCILHPVLGGSNLATELGLDEDTGYNVQMISLTRRRYRWTYFNHVIEEAQISEQYFAWRRELPDPSEMARRLERHGFETGELNFALRQPHAGLFGTVRDWIRFQRMHAKGLTKPKLPLVTGVSDFVVVPRRHMPEFVRICHVFTAMGLFVEAALPTALALACPKIKSEPDSSWKATFAWGEQAQNALLEPMQKSMRRIGPAFAPRELLKHPVKLSYFVSDLA